jgi:hypothetical protein
MRDLKALLEIVKNATWATWYQECEGCSKRSVCVSCDADYDEEKEPVCFAEQCDDREHIYFRYADPEKGGGYIGYIEGSCGFNNIMKFVLEMANGGAEEAINRAIAAEERIKELEAALEAQKVFWPLIKTCDVGTCKMCGQYTSSGMDIYCQKCAAKIGSKALKGDPKDAS